MEHTSFALKCLQVLLDYGQFEIIDFKSMTPGRDNTDCRVVYLMNDCVESFIIFRNIRYTGTYIEEFDGELHFDLDPDKGVLLIRQDNSHLLLFFDAIDMDIHYYNYDGIGHFWIDNHELLRNLEFMISIVRNKFDYLGEDSCNEAEKKLAALKNFPPLSYLFYPAISDKWITPLENPWYVSQEAVSIFLDICSDVNDTSLYHAVTAYSKKPTRLKAAGIARRLRPKKHQAVIMALYDLIHQGANAYPRRSFGDELDHKLDAVLEDTRSRYPDKRYMIFREEPFVWDLDDISFKISVLDTQCGPFQKEHIVEYSTL